MKMTHQITRNRTLVSLQQTFWFKCEVAFDLTQEDTSSHKFLIMSSGMKVNSSAIPY